MDTARTIKGSTYAPVSNMGVPIVDNNSHDQTSHDQTSHDQTSHNQTTQCIRRQQQPYIGAYGSAIGGHYD